MWSAEFFGVSASVHAVSLPTNTVVMQRFMAHLAGRGGRTLPAARTLSAVPDATESLLIASPPGLRVVDLNRPAALNALDAEMVRVLLPLVQDWNRPDQTDVKLIVFRGSGERAFCAGGDIRHLRDCALGEGGEGGATLAAAEAFFREEYTLNHALGTGRTPVVSILEGLVMGQ